ncbi:WD repeat-containing protein 25 [Glycine soja]
MECMEQKSEESMPAKLPVFHNAAVKDVKWSQQGHFLLSCGYDCTSRLIDVEKGLETQVFRQDQIVGVIKLHPDDSNLFLSEGSKGQIKLCDARTGKVVHDYNQNLGLILDVEFTMNGKQFISSSDVSQSNASENAIIVWDVSREVPLSNQSCVILLRHKFRNSICTSTTVKAAYNDPPQYLCIVRSLRALGYPYSTIAEASTHDSRATSRIDPVGNTVINLMKGIQTQLLRWRSPKKVSSEVVASVEVTVGGRGSSSIAPRENLETALSRVYVEAYTCPCVSRHQFDSIFVSQSNGNYVVIFTTTPPYRLNKYKQYEGHVVSGFPIKCNFSLDGKKLASGSSDCSIYIYDYQL